MLIALMVAAIGVGIDLLGMKGFSEDGIPLTYERNLDGTAGRMVGVVCLLIGSPIALAGLLLMVMSAGR
ncbi:MAG: hypothetical protein WBD40_06665 [Tepidisphaeraceae bacterium]